MHLHKSGARLALFAVLVAALMALTATTAFAGPADPTLDVIELQAAIDANGGSLPGYMKTVIKNDDIRQLNVTVLAVTTGYGSGPADMSSLILFESDDPVIEDLGGIAAGMSGSPIYVDDGTGTDKLVGALSYGDMFTTRGTGLATPIEAMANLQANYAVASALPRKLESPVIVEGQIKDRIMVTSDPDAIAVEPANTIVAKPLASVYLGGVSPKSKLYKAYAKALESRGIELATPREGGLSAKVSTYSAEFEGGSAIAVLAARGDLWSGGIGTVTYVDTPTVVAFGHPAYYEGDTNLYLCNAWIDGVWPSTYMAYKLGRPAAVRGTLTQDRLAGIAGVDGPKPVDIPVTAKATRGSKVATSAVQLPSHVADSSNDAFWGLPTFGTYVAGSRLYDAAVNKGSALTTTTVVVQDGAGPIYTLVRPNVYSSEYDISSAVITDVDEMVTSIQSANSNGIADGHILSVDLESEFSDVRNDAEIVDVDVEGGMRTGDNTVTVSFLKFGEVDTQTVDVTITLPEEVPAMGQLSVSSVNSPGDGGEFIDETFLEELFGMGLGESGVDRRTVKDVVSELSEGVDNTVISVSFQPEFLSPGDGEYPGYYLYESEFEAIETTVATEWVVSGTVTKTAPGLQIYDRAISYGRYPFVYGYLLGVDGPAVIEIAGLDPTPVTAEVMDGMIQYYGETPLYTNKVATVTFEGNDSALPVQATFDVDVRAKMTLSVSDKSVPLGSSVKLTAKVLPKTTGGYVAIQRLAGSSWSTLKKVRVPSSGIVTYTATPSKKGTHRFRAVFLGSSKNSRSYSSVTKVTVK